MKIFFFDWAPVRKKSDILSGGHVRRYYSWITLNKSMNKVIPFRKENGKINWKILDCLYEKDAVLWVEYGCGRVAHIFVLLLSSLRQKKIILNVHDFVIQQKYYYKDYTFFKKLQVHLLEQLLLYRANTIIFSWPGLIEYTKFKKKKKFFIMPPGIGADELIIPTISKNRTKKTALYFGSMQRMGIMTNIIDLFSQLKGWELILIGLKEGQEIIENENVNYLGVKSHDELNDIFEKVDVILIPLPKNKYTNKTMIMKIGYALKSCKPLIATNLEGISEYVSMLNLEKNVLYMDEWNLKNLKEALQNVSNINIDPEKTIEILKHMAWEPRYNKIIEAVIENKNEVSDQIEWV